MITRKDGICPKDWGTEESQAPPCEQFVHFSVLQDSYRGEFASRLLRRSNRRSRQRVGFQVRSVVSASVNWPSHLRLLGTRREDPADPSALEASWPDCSPPSVLASLCGSSWPKQQLWYCQRRRFRAG